MDLGSMMGQVCILFGVVCVIWASLFRASILIVFTELLDRSFGDNLMFPKDSLQKTKIRKFCKCFEFSMFHIDLNPFVCIVFQYLFDMDFGIDFN